MLRSRAFPSSDSCQVSAVWCGRPAIRSMLMFAMPAARRRAMSSSTVARLCKRPTAAASASTNDCTPRLTRFTPQRSSPCKHLGPERSGRTLDRHFGIGPHRELRADRVKDPLQLSGLEDGGRSAAEVDGVDFAVDLAAHFLCALRSIERRRRRRDRRSARRRPAKIRPRRSCSSCTSCGRTARRCRFPRPPFDYPTLERGPLRLSLRAGPRHIQPFPSSRLPRPSI